MLSEQFNGCIVDTSNEIAGDGDVPHPCVSFARRMMVPSLNEQSSVMVQCVENHTPDVMVIDEIGRVAEVEAARTCNPPTATCASDCSRTENSGDRKSVV